MEAAAFAGSACALKTTRYVCTVPEPVARTPCTARSKATIATDAKIARRRGAWNLVMVHPSSCASGDRLFGGAIPSTIGSATLNEQIGKRGRARIVSERRAARPARPHHG